MLRQGLSAPGLYSVLRQKSLKISGNRLSRPQTIPIADAVMSAASMFALKSPSMLQFEKSLIDPVIKNNLQKLFHIKQVPSDTSMREILDPVDTKEIQNLFKPLISEAQRGKAFEGYTFLNDSYLLSLDGTGSFSSNKIHCQNCCVKNHRDGIQTFYHQLVGGVIVHPNRKQVIPFAPEPISLPDGSTKNDCERNASKRFLERFRREHPHLKVTVVEDGLASNAPHIALLNKLNLNYILGCKKGDHKSLFEFIDESEKLGVIEHFEITEDSISHKFRFMNGVALNDSNPDCIVNFIEYWEINEKTGKKQHFSWITDIEITPKNLMKIMRGGRARWKIENETFNTLKNLGYNFEHNFGHGNQNLSNNLAIIMMLVFLIDQLQQISCRLFQKGVERAERMLYFWQRMRNYFFVFKLNSWEDLLNALAFGIDTTSFKVNTS